MTLANLIGVSKYYRASDVETRALDNVDLAVREGELIAITGKSGSGKSTLLNILGTVEQPSSGQYFIDDQDVTGYSDGARAKLRRSYFGFIFQSFNLIEHMTVRENIELPLKYRKEKKSQRTVKVDEWLARLEISGRAKHYPAQLSGGQQQRVAIARALVGKPRILLADEPTGNLDLENSNKIIEILKQLNIENGTAVILVTHDREQASQCKRVLNLVDGAIA